MTEAVDLSDFSEEIAAEKSERTKDRLNNFLVGLVAVLVTALITGIAAWLSFDPSAYVSAFEKTYATREALQEKLSNIKEEMDKMPWSKDKPYIINDVVNIRADIKELQNAVKSIVRVEDKIDTIITDLKELKVSEKETSNRVLKLETKRGIP